MTILSIRNALQEARGLLTPLSDTSPGLDAEILLSLTLDKPRSHLHAWPDKPLNPDQQDLFQSFIRRRAQGEPIAYITGCREFWSLELQVTPDTLIPRHETERLVERALELIPGNLPLRIADLGTGCGAIAAAIARERPQCQITATDRSAAALGVARSNFQHLGLPNVLLREGEWCKALPESDRFDFILSNPPYIPDGDSHMEQGDLPWEPKCALAAGPDGLSAIRHIISETPSHLTPGGWLLLEHGYDQGSKIRQLLANNGFKHIRTLQDLAGQDRITEGQNQTDPT